MPADFFDFGLSEDQEERARKVWSESLVFDACVTGPNIDHRECIDEFRQGGINGGILTVAAAREDFVQGMDKMLTYRKFIRDNEDEFQLVTSVEEMDDAKPGGRMGLVFGFQDAKPIGDKLENLDAFHGLGLRVMHLTYNTQNVVGSGCIELHYNGLTWFGRDVVREMNRLGIAIDLSHSSDATTFDAIERSEKPCLLSHSCAYAVCPALGRNAPDDQIKLLAERGGVIGVVFRPNFIRRDGDHRPLPSTVNDLLDHVDHIVNLVGVDHVGFGSDTCTQFQIPGTRYSPWLIRFRQLRPDVFGLCELWEVTEGLTTPLEFINLARGLVARGYSDEDIGKFLGRNFQRVLGTIWNVG